MLINIDIIIECIYVEYITYKYHLIDVYIQLTYLIKDQLEHNF